MEQVRTRSVESEHLSASSKAQCEAALRHAQHVRRDSFVVRATSDRDGWSGYW